MFRHRQEPKIDDKDKDKHKKRQRQIQKDKDSSLNVTAGDVWEGAAGARGNQPEGDAARAEVHLTKALYVLFEAFFSTLFTIWNATYFTIKYSQGSH